MENNEKKHEELKQKEEEIMNYKPEHFLGVKDQNDIRMLARQEAFQLIKELGLLK